jgi:hypothetical protein
MESPKSRPSPKPTTWIEGREASYPYAVLELAERVRPGNSSFTRLRCEAKIPCFIPSLYYSYSINNILRKGTAILELILCHRDLAITFEAVVLCQPASPDAERLLRETSRVLAEASPDKPFEMGREQLQVARDPLETYCQHIPPHRRGKVDSTAETIAGAMFSPSGTGAAART